MKIIQNGQDNAVRSYFIKPWINQLQAVPILNKPGSFFSSKRTLLQSCCIYLPIYLFEIRTIDRRGHEVQHEVCVDAIDGQFAHIQTKNLEKNKESEKSVQEFLLTLPEAEYIARREFRTHIFRFHPALKILKIGLTAKAWYPFWIGYYHSKKGYSFEVIDGCSGKRQGVKMHALFCKIVLKNSDHLKNDRVAQAEERSTV